MKANLRSRGSYKWQPDVSNSRVSRSKTKVKPTAAAAAFLVALSIVVSTLYLGVVQDSLEEKLSIGTKGFFDWTTRGTQPSLPDGCEWSCYVEN
jgi:hypothetical protein